MSKAHVSIRLFFTFLLVSFCCSYLFFNVWKVSAIRGGDNMGYYSYLPATFIYHDLNNLEKTFNARDSICHVSTYDGEMPQHVSGGTSVQNQNRVIKYTMGLAILQSPFFFLIHSFQKITGGPAGGFEFPYMLSVFLSVLFYIFLGFYFLQKVLLKWFSPGITAVTLFAVFFATNIFYYSSFNIGMSHAYLFFLYSLLVYIIPRFYEIPNWKNAVTLGLTLGMIALIRPSEAIAVLIPVLYGFGFSGSLKNKSTFIKNNWQLILLTGIAILLVPLPQFYYWKKMSGHWLYDSYPGEHFNFLRAHIADGLFGWKNGWLSYTPVMIFVFPGLFFLWKKRNFYSLPICIFLPMHVYIIYSWWGWSYTNGFGSRPMVETYPLLAVALAAFFTAVFSFRLGKLIMIPVLTFFAIINIFKVIQIEHSYYYSDDATWNFYKRRLFKWQYDYKDVVAFDSEEVQPDENRLILIQRFYNESFEDKPALIRDNQNKYSGNYSAVLKPGTDYNGTIEFNLQNTRALKGDYLKISAWCYLNSLPQDIFGSAKLVTEINREGNRKKWVGIRIENKIRKDSTVQTIWGGDAGVWRQIHYWVKLPNDYTGDEMIKVYPWNPGGADLRIDDIAIELWRKIK